MHDLNHLEFSRAWQEMLAKLTSDEQEMIDATIAGAAVNYSLLYMLVSFVIGTGFGWAVFSLMK